MASSFRKVCGFAVHTRTAAAFLDFSTLRPVFKKVRCQVLRFQDLCGRSAKTLQNLRFRKREFSCGRPLKEKTSFGRSAIGAPFSSQIKLGSH